LIKAVADLAKDKFGVILFENLSSIPHFNPDLDNEHPPQAVIDFRKQLKEAEGILICTPEYAMGVPGTLKNAIDWTVSSMEFSKKPTALITASSMGEKGHASLLETLKVIEADITDETQLLIPFAKTKVSQDCKITDSKTLCEVNVLLDAFLLKINRNERNL
jgi:chromate reductase, NAD(P)H dehydrogenase (quinone)